MNGCDNDTDGVLDTIQGELDAAEVAGQKVLVALMQGINLPEDWLDECETFLLSDGRFEGDSCLPWDTKYQQRIASFYSSFGERFDNHSALAAVYFTHPMMTNGAEWHFRMDYDEFVAEVDYPGDDGVLAALNTLFDLHADPLPNTPIVFEAGHTAFMTGSKARWNTAEVVYEHALAKVGADRLGIAAWNCAERQLSATGGEHEMQPLFLQAGEDGVSVGCQTIGNFQETPCRFTDTTQGLVYGTINPGVGNSDCADGVDVSLTNYIACNETLHWFAGLATHASEGSGSRPFAGTWVESWTLDVKWDNAVCQAAIDLLAVQGYSNVTNLDDVTTTPSISLSSTTTDGSSSTTSPSTPSGDVGVADMVNSAYAVLGASTDLTVIVVTLSAFLTR
jgi:hypothetical protein